MLSWFTAKKKFNISLTTTVYSTIYVIDQKSPITWISRELDGDWQFMSDKPIGDDYKKLAKLVTLGEVVKLDKSVLEVADLPMGYCATRASKKEKWSIARIEYTEQEMKEFGFYCSTCGIYHKQIPMAYGAQAPYQYTLVPENEREQRCVITNDQCIIDDKQYFVRGRIELLVDNTEDSFFGMFGFNLVSLILIDTLICGKTITEY